MRNVMFAATGIIGCFIMAGCQYQPAPLAPDPYTQSTFLGNDWPIGDGKPGPCPLGETVDERSWKDGPGTRTRSSPGALFAAGGA